MTSRHEALDAAIAAVDEADDALPFSDLVRIAAQGRAFDKARHMRFGDWSDVDFEKSKLVGFDFTGAHIIGCKFAGASIAGARFDKAIIDIVQPYAKLDPQRTSLRAAADWGAYVKSWRRSDNPPDDSHLPIGAIFQDAPFAPEMVVVPPGTYMRGSMEQQYSRPVREVTIAHRFAVGRFPVTFEEWDFSQKHTEWQRLSHQELRYPDDRQWGRRRRPVIHVNWHDAQAYARWISGVTGEDYRLLTEAEWEYCCRAGTNTRFCNGDDESRIAEVAWFNRNSGAKVQAVGEKASNDWGLHDMHGNVWEWCEDCWSNNYIDEPEDGTARNAADLSVPRVARGGSWGYRAVDLRSAHRGCFQPVLRGVDLGFRLARTLNP